MLMPVIQALERLEQDYYKAEGLPEKQRRKEGRRERTLNNLRVFTKKLSTVKNIDTRESY